MFGHPFWDHVREKVSSKAVAMREQGFSGCAMLPYQELEYGGIVKRMEGLDARFHIRREKSTKRRK